MEENEILANSLKEQAIEIFNTKAKEKESKKAKTNEDKQNRNDEDLGLNEDNYNINYSSDKDMENKHKKEKKHVKFYLFYTNFLKTFLIFFLISTKFFLNNYNSEEA